MLDISRTLPKGVVDWYGKRTPTERQTVELLFTLSIGAGIGCAAHKLARRPLPWNIEWTAAAGMVFFATIWANEFGIGVALAFRSQPIKAEEHQATFPVIPHLNEGSCWFASVITALAPLLHLGDTQYRERMVPAGPLPPRPTRFEEFLEWIWPSHEERPLQERLSPLFAHLFASREPMNRGEFARAFRALYSQLHGNQGGYNCYADPTEAFLRIMEELDLDQRLGFQSKEKVTLTSYLMPTLFRNGQVEMLRGRIDPVDVEGDPSTGDPFSFPGRTERLEMLKILPRPPIAKSLAETLEDRSLQEAIGSAFSDSTLLKALEKEQPEEELAKEFERGRLKAALAKAYPREELPPGEISASDLPDERNQLVVDLCRQLVQLTRESRDESHFVAAVTASLTDRSNDKRRCLARRGDTSYLTEGAYETALTLTQPAPVLPVMVNRFQYREGGGLQYCDGRMQAPMNLTIATEDEGNVAYRLVSFTVYGGAHHWAHVNWLRSWQLVDDMRGRNIDEGECPTELDQGYFYLYVREDLWSPPAELGSVRGE